MILIQIREYRVYYKFRPTKYFGEQNFRHSCRFLPLFSRKFFRRLNIYLYCYCCNYWHLHAAATFLTPIRFCCVAMVSCCHSYQRYHSYHCCCRRNPSQQLPVQNRMMRRPNNLPHCYCSTNRYRMIARCNRSAVAVVGGPIKNTQCLAFR